MTEILFGSDGGLQLLEEKSTAPDAAKPRPTS
jgi:hypothetical protein